MTIISVCVWRGLDADTVANSTVLGPPTFFIIFTAFSHWKPCTHLNNLDAEVRPCLLPISGWLMPVFLFGCSAHTAMSSGNSFLCLHATPSVLPCEHLLCVLTYGTCFHSLNYGQVSFWFPLYRQENWDSKKKGSFPRWVFMVKNDTKNTTFSRSGGAYP